MHGEFLRFLRRDGADARVLQTGRREQQFGGSAHGSSNNLSGLGGVSPRGSSVTVEEERELVPEDYSQTTKLLFLPEGNSGGPFPTPPHRLPFAFGFKDYTPHVFRALRALNNVDEADYMTSLAGDFNYIEFLANSKSGQFFFYSHDGRFMIKTQTREEAKLLREMLPSYVKHLVEHPDSLLARFYGLHRVEMPTLKRRTFFVVMQSVFYCPVEPPLALHVKFDLKGSTVGRRTDDADCADGAVQKDLNFAEQRRRIVLGRDKVLLFAETLRADTNYLKELRIMDYSLLLGVHDPSEERRLSQLSQQRQQRRRSSGGVVLARVSLALPSLCSRVRAASDALCMLTAAPRHGRTRFGALRRARRRRARRVGGAAAAAEPVGGAVDLQRALRRHPVGQRGDAGGVLHGHHRHPAGVQHQQAPRELLQGLFARPSTAVGRRPGALRRTDGAVSAEALRLRRRHRCFEVLGAWRPRCECGGQWQPTQQ